MKRFRTAIVATHAGALVLGGMLAGCGKKGPPLAPLQLLPARVQDVRATRQADSVRITFTIPNKNEDGTTPADIAYVLVYGVTRAAEADPVPGPGDTALPNPEPLWVVRLMMPQLFPRMAEILQILGASGYMSAASAAEVDGPVAGDVERYYQGATIPADQRVELFRLGWELSCSAFAGRQVLYERFGGGDPWRLALARYRSYRGKQAAIERVAPFLPAGSLA